MVCRYVWVVSWRVHCCSIHVCYYKYKIFQNGLFRKLSLEKNIPLFISYRSADPIRSLISCTACYYTWRGFRDLPWILISVLIHRFNNAKLVHCEITVLHLIILSCTYLERKLQNIFLVSLIIPFCFIRQLSQRTRNNVSVITYLFRFPSFISRFMNTNTQRSITHCTSQLYY